MDSHRGHLVFNGLGVHPKRNGVLIPKPMGGHGKAG